METIREFKDTRAPSTYHIWHNTFTSARIVRKWNKLPCVVCDTVYHKSIDATNMLCRDWDYCFKLKLMSKMFEKVGEDKVVHIVRKMKPMWSLQRNSWVSFLIYIGILDGLCSLLFRLVKGIYIKSSMKLVINNARNIPKFIYDINGKFSYMKKSIGELTRLFITCFATQFIMMEGVLR